MYRTTLFIIAFVFLMVGTPLASAYVKIHMPVRQYIRMPADAEDMVRPAGWPDWIGFEGATTPTYSNSDWVIEYAPAGWSLYGERDPNWPSWIDYAPWAVR